MFGRTHKGICEDQKVDLLFCLLKSDCCQKVNIIVVTIFSSGKRRESAYQTTISLGSVLLFDTTLIVVGQKSLTKELVLEVIDTRTINMSVLVTVGTTSFNSLIQEVNTPRFLLALSSLGYNKLSLQYGNGEYEPLEEKCPLEIEAFRFKADLSPFFADSSLVISHGGAGTCMEALTPPGKRKLIIVINEDLMDNHQQELASTLFECKHAFVCRVQDLYAFLVTGKTVPFEDLSLKPFWNEKDPKKLLGPSTSPECVGLVPFHRGKASLLVDFINNLLGAPEFL